MKWIVVAIVAVLVPYTFVTLHFRKPNPAFRPYEDMKNRANVVRLLSAGYQRIQVTADRAADPLRLSAPAVTAPAPGGLPPELQATLVEPPLLPQDILQVTAAESVNALFAYPIAFTCAVADDKQYPTGAAVYVKEDQVIITPTFERVSGDLLTRTREPGVVVTLPAGALKPGRYDAVLVGERSSLAWSFEVR
jgi:hypothetical protein